MAEEVGSVSGGVVDELDDGLEGGLVGGVDDGVDDGLEESEELSELLVEVDVGGSVVGSEVGVELGGSDAGGDVVGSVVEIVVGGGVGVSPEGEVDGEDMEELHKACEPGWTEERIDRSLRGLRGCRRRIPSGRLGGRGWRSIVGGGRRAGSFSSRNGLRRSRGGR